MSKGKRLRGGGRRQRGRPVMRRDVVTDPGLCDGVEIEHGDGHTECSEGTDCRGGLHTLGISCGLARGMGRYEMRHACSECA